MKKRILFIILMFFKHSTFAMEEQENGSDKISLSVSRIQKNSNQDVIEKHKDSFDLLPDELILNIFSLLIEDAYAIGTDALEKLVNIFSDKVFARIKCVNNRFNRIFADDQITNKINKLRGHLFQNNKAVFEEKFLQICGKKHNDKITKQNFKTLTLVKCCLKAINTFMIKRKQFYNFNPRFKDLSIQNQEEIINLYNDYKKIKCLLKANIINVENPPAFSGLIIATSSFNKEVIEEILKHISNYDINIQLGILNAKDIFGSTCLIIAAVCDERESVEIILKSISRFDIINKLKVINAKDRDGLTALTRASFWNRKEIVRIIIDYIKDFDPDFQLSIINQNFMSKTILEYAKSAGFLEIVALLEQTIKKINQNKQAIIDK